MTENPYRPPLSVGRCTPRGNTWRARSLLSIRVTLIVLLIPAAYNYWAFDSLLLTARQFPQHHLWMRATHISAIIAGSTLIWFLGLLVLERASQTLRFLFASHTSQLAWNEILYRSLVLAPAFAIPGAILWGLWIFGFYQLRIGFHDISWKLGVPMHLLASGWYLTLLIRWYRLAQMDRTAVVK